MQYKKITVIGGSGFVGRALVQKLARTGARIRIGCRHVKEGHFLQTMGEVGQISIISCDVFSQQGLQSLIDGSEVVVNLLGIMSETGKQTFENVHINAADHIAKAAAALNVQRLIHMSALGADLQSESIYARTKALGEEAVLKAFPHATIVRPSLIFGKGDHFFNLFAQIALISPILPLIGGGHTNFQPIYVEDVAQCFFRIIENESTRGQTYELGGPNMYSFKELLMLMLETIGRKRFLIPIPFGIASLMGRVLELFPSPLLTRDQVALLKTDTVPAKNALTAQDLEVEVQSLTSILPLYLARFHKHF